MLEGDDESAFQKKGDHVPFLFLVKPERFEGTPILEIGLVRLGPDATKAGKPRAEDQQLARLEWRGDGDHLVTPPQDATDGRSDLGRRDRAADLDPPAHHAPTFTSGNETQVCFGASPEQLFLHACW